MNSYDFFIYEFICFMNSYMNSGVPRFQMVITSIATATSQSTRALQAINLQRLSSLHQHCFWLLFNQNKILQACKAYHHLASSLFTKIFVN